MGKRKKRNAKGNKTNKNTIVSSKQDTYKDILSTLKPRHDKVIEIFTDGACNQLKDGGYAFVILDPRCITYASGYANNTSNNRMELSAIIEALAMIKPTYFHINIYTDSGYVVDMFNKGWLKNWLNNNFKNKEGEPIKNKDLILRLYEFTKKFSITFKWTPGHSKDNNLEAKCNNFCDYLAKTAIKQKVGKYEMKKLIEFDDTPIESENNSISTEKEINRQKTVLGPKTDDDSFDIFSPKECSIKSNESVTVEDKIKNLNKSYKNTYSPELTQNFHKFKNQILDNKVNKLLAFTYSFENISNTVEQIISLTNKPIHIHQIYVASSGIIQFNIKDKNNLEEDKIVIFQAYSTCSSHIINEKFESGSNLLVVIKPLNAQSLDVHLVIIYSETSIPLSI